MWSGNSNLFSWTNQFSRFSQTPENSKMFNVTSKYFSFFNHQLSASWVAHITRNFLTYYSCSYYISMFNNNRKSLKRSCWHWAMTCINWGFKWMFELCHSQIRTKRVQDHVKCKTRKSNTSLRSTFIFQPYFSYLICYLLCNSKLIILVYVTNSVKIFENRFNLHISYILLI